MVWTREVLTTHQLLQAAFDNDHTGRHRLVTLNRLGALDRFRPRLPLGSAPWHYVLGEARAAVLALEGCSAWSARPSTSSSISNADWAQGRVLSGLRGVANGYVIGFKPLMPR
ncbi:replication-relaxation family protein [Microbispora sp. KK1-11]|uniref:replication-relaxation family protein n=1 Tax=Microbispora sp. KK1-11 TaxID=2053005 RepID=UPI0011573ADA|nr:replication-relaxation family protein [Microbispora sp. KK1-11]TQS27155.1 hypothetical protein FLW16_20650 [Microbispora sp. KK1-11]